MLWILRALAAILLINSALHCLDYALNGAWGWTAAWTIVTIATLVVTRWAIRINQD